MFFFSISFLQGCTTSKLVELHISTYSRILDNICWLLQHVIPCKKMAHHSFFLFFAIKLDGFIISALFLLFYKHSSLTTKIGKNKEIKDW